MATLQERLDEAEAAFHDLLIGKAVAEVRDANGETIRYTQTNRAALSAYIADLKRQLGTTSVSGPLRPFFT
ncbi:phage tail protein [Novosphingobium sp. YJ-S2-02]|uniref:Phage tail protein n=1 Tax=Novosphingobium aureum TaxID=2792964 RepID=A0A931MLB9_9SPHN|nr:gpW family head-tail joining protein [Novosphingobium aureum]MBH0113275.1 phage tail protein [Novosphingobium aureum]